MLKEVKVMKNFKFVITVPHLLSSISALSAESRLYIISLHFNVHATLQINSIVFLSFNNIHHLLNVYREKQHFCNLILNSFDKGILLMISGCERKGALNLLTID
jgi:hypothetical protein